MKVNKIVKYLVNEYGWSNDRKFTDRELKLIKDTASIVSEKSGAKSGACGGYITALALAKDRLREYADSDEDSGLNGYGCYDRPWKMVDKWIKEIDDIIKTNSRK